MKHRLITRYASLVLALALTAGLLPAGALASAENAEVQTVQSEAVQPESMAQSEEAYTEEAVSEAESAAAEPGPVQSAESESAASAAQAAEPEEPSSAPRSESLPAAPEETPQPASEAQPAADEPEPQAIVIPDEPDSFTCTLRFYAGENLVSEQVLSAGETPVQPPSPTQENAVFEGWFDASGNACDFGQPIGALSENTVIEYTARMKQSYIVYYFSAPEGGAVLYTQTYEDSADTVQWQQVAFAAPEGMALAGWSLTPGGEAVQNPVLTAEPLCLYPVLVKAYWITPHGQGGTAPDPVYVLPGQAGPEMAAAERQGYRFTGWFTDTDCTQTYTPGQPVNADLQLYAGWEAVSVTYRIAYWQQNPDDDGYSLAEVEQRTALTDSLVQPNPAQDRYANFTLKERPAAQTVAGDGCTVIAVYYDRNVYTVWFYQNNKEITELTISARYGANIADKWPSRVNSKWPNQWRTNQKYNPSGNQYQSGIATMPAPNDSENPNKFYYVNESGRYTHELRYYLETLQGGTWELGHTDSFKSSSTNWQLTENDRYDIKGFTINNQKSPKSGATEKKLGDKLYGFELYYDRNKYNIEFYSAGELDKTVTLAYEAPLAGQQYTPVYPGDSEMVFVGWYTNNLGQGEPFDFSGTMPAGSFALYALWREPTYRVSFDLAGGTAPEGADFDDQLVKRGELAEQPGSEPVREGWRFLGWSCEGKLFSFLTPIRKNTCLTALWASESSYHLSYDPGAGRGNAFEATTRFSEGALVQLAVPPAEWQPPQAGTGFLGWSTTPEGTGSLLQPGETLAMPGQDTVLYAQWGTARTVSLVYDFNGGTDQDGNSEKTVTIAQPNEDYAIEELAPTREGGYLFTGWSTQPSGGRLLQAGDVIRVNTLQPETNRLYAQWEKAVITEVRLVVEGSMGEKKRDFAFTAKLPGSGQNFTLRHGGSYVFDPQPESADPIEVQQEDVTRSGYTTTVTEETVNGRRIITFTNVRDVIVPTGLRQQGLPAVLALCGGCMIAAAVWALRRRHL